MQTMLQTHDLAKHFGKNKILSDISIQVQKGSVYGLVGPNGAGKSTLFKILTGLLRPDFGKVVFMGQEISFQTENWKSAIGSLIERPCFYETLTARENLWLHAGYLGLSDNGEIDQTLQMVGLFEARDKRVGEFSIGMKQRLGIARAILPHPELVILDEPLNGLDPEGVLEMRRLIRRLREEEGISFLISNHILKEMESIADQIGFLKNGRILKELSMDEIYQQTTGYTEIKVDRASYAGAVLEEAGIRELKIPDNTTVRVYDSGVRGSDITRRLVQAGILVESLIPKKDTLEDYFIQLYGDQDDAEITDAGK